jgi:hypothetical protein
MQDNQPASAFRCAILQKDFERSKKTKCQFEQFATKKPSDYRLLLKTLQTAQQIARYKQRSV